jgi:hypothetical protein
VGGDDAAGRGPGSIRRVQAGGVHAVPVFAGSCLAVWATAGTAVYAVDRPHGSVAAGVTLIVAGAYEFTPLKRQFRRRCRASAASGFGYGLCCAGSSIGLMATPVALDVISIPRMALITIVVLAQKPLPARAAIDMPLALAIIGLGILIILAPSSFPRSRRQRERSASRRQCARRSGRGLRLDATRAVSPQRADRRLGAARSCAGGLGGPLQIVRFWASVAQVGGNWRVPG